MRILCVQMSVILLYTNFIICDAKWITYYNFLKTFYTQNNMYCARPLKMVNWFISLLTEDIPPKFSIFKIKLSFFSFHQATKNQVKKNVLMKKKKYIYIFIYLFSKNNIYKKHSSVCIFRRLSLVSRIFLFLPSNTKICTRRIYMYQSIIINI